MTIQEVMISEICDTGSGGTPSRTKQEIYFGGSIPWVKSGELRESVILETEESLTDLGLQESSAKLLPRDTLLVALYGATVGRVGILGIEATTNQAVCYLIPDDKRVNRRYLFHALRSRVPYWLTQRVGGGQPNISQGVIKNTKIPLPPLDEQKRIAEILDRAEALRSQRRAALALLDELTQSIFLDMFGDPVTNPKGWPVRVFEDVCDSRLGKMLDAKKQVGDNLRPYMRNINVQWGRLDLSTVWEMDFSEKDREELRLVVNDVLICEGGAGVAQTAVWRGEIAECYFQKSLHRVRPKPCCANSEYIAFLFRMLMREGSELFRLVSSATIPHLTGVKLKTLKIPVPPVDLQRRFGAATISVESEKSRMHEHVACFDELITALQHRAFRGEL